jgi:hypothetical protein
MAIAYTPQYSFNATVTNAGIFAVQVTTMPSITVTGADGSILDGSDTAIKATVVSYANANVIAVRLSDTNGNYIAPGAATVSISPISLLCTVTAVGIFRITSLPDLGLNSSIKITSLPSLAFGQSVTITNGAILSVTNLVSVLSTNTTYRYNANQVYPLTGYWRFTSTYTSAQTNAILIPLPSSFTAIHLTDVIFANSGTEGNLSLIQSRSNAGISPIIETIYLRPYGGAVLDFNTPVVLDTNAALVLTSRSVTAHSVTVVGYTQ